MLADWHLSLRAIDATRKAEELPGSDAMVRAEVGLVRGQALLQSGRHEPARGVLKEVVKAMPRADVRALVLLGMRDALRGWAGIVSDFPARV